MSETLDLFQFKDHPKGRHAYINHIDQWIRDEKGEPQVDDVTFQSRIDRGWYWGGAAFKEAMLVTLSQMDNRNYRSSQLGKDFAEADARQILVDAKRHFGLDDTQIKTVIRGDLTRAAIACRIFHETTVTQKWIAEQLGMKTPANVCRQIRVFKDQPATKLPRKIKQWLKYKNR